MDVESPGNSVTMMYYIWPKLPDPIFGEIALKKYNWDKGRWDDIAATVDNSGDKTKLTTVPLVDGGPYDADRTADGVYSDPSGPALPSLIPGDRGGRGGRSLEMTPIPTLSQWMMTVLAGMLLLVGIAALRRTGRV